MYRFFFSRLCALMLFACMAVACRAAEDIVAYTEDFPPYNFLDGEGRPAGFSVELLAVLMKEAGLGYRIELVPWARAVQSVRRTPDSLLFTTARTPEREGWFDWVGPFAARRTVLVGLHGGIQPANLDAVRRQRVAVINGDAGMEFLLSNGFAIGLNVLPVSRRNDLPRFLFSGQADFVAANPAMLRAVAARAGFQAGLLEDRITLVEMPAGFYFALSKQTRPALRERIEAAFKRLRERGEIDALRRRYDIE